MRSAQPSARSACARWASALAGANHTSPQRRGIRTCRNTDAHLARAARLSVRSAAMTSRRWRAERIPSTSCCPSTVSVHPTGNRQATSANLDELTLRTVFVFVRQISSIEALTGCSAQSVAGSKCSRNGTQGSPTPRRCGWSRPSSVSLRLTRRKDFLCVVGLSDSVLCAGLKLPGVENRLDLESALT